MDLFTYVIVNLIIIYRMVAEVILEYTSLRFEFFCQDYPSFNSWVHHSSGPLVGGGQWRRWMDSAAAMKGGGQGAAGAGETGGAVGARLP